MTKLRWIGILGPALGVVLALGPAPARAIDQFNASMMPALPDTAYVELNSERDLTFEVDATAREFNGYTVILKFNPSVVWCDTLIDEGPLFTNACPNRFTWTQHTDSTRTYTHVLLCNGVSVDGPGVLSIYHFHGLRLGVTPVTIISDPNQTFFDAGLYVSPSNPVYPRQVIFHNQVIRVVGPNSGVGHRPVSPRDGTSALHLLSLPNPAPGRGLLSFVLAAPGAASARIFDLQGRLLWSWTDARAQAGPRTVSWELRAPQGGPAPAGSYLCRVSGGGSTAAERLIVIR